MMLSEYNKKRDFKATSEPKGRVKKTKGRRFVVQYHEARAKHYDFRIEHNGVLISWAVPKGLSNSPKDKRLAVKVEDHPLDYISFEGIIPKGNYGAGTVEIFDQGEYLPIEDLDKGLKKGHIKVVLNGEKLKGGWSLFKTDGDNWLVVKLDDEYAKSETKRKKPTLPFSFCPLQLATLSSKIPRGKDWVFEIKYDGYRMLSLIENDKVKIKSRNDVDYTSKFPNICQSLKSLEGTAVLDGEMVVFDENGRSDFGLLQESIKKKKRDFYYIVFDLLFLNGQDIRKEPLKTRKEKLERFLFKCEKSIIFSSHVDKGKESFEFAKKNNLEGIIAKRLSSPYVGRRSEDWLKIKCYRRQEFVIGGYTQTEKNEFISALLLGFYRGKDFVFAGKVGTGFNESMKKELFARFQKLLRKTCPFSERIEIKNALWLKPELVAEIQFAEFTKEKVLRQPSFISLRSDKEAKEVKLESDYDQGN